MVIRIESHLTRDLRYTYHFDVIRPLGGEENLTVKLSLFLAHSKPPGKRKWVEVGRWDSHFKRACSVEQPFLPQDVVDAAREQLIKRIVFNPPADVADVG